jgi:hypothetical protein
MQANAGYGFKHLLRASLQRSPVPGETVSGTATKAEGLLGLCLRRYEEYEEQ